MPNYNNDILIQNVRKLMEDNNITQQQLADILDMSQSNVSKALSASDKKNFTLDQVAGIAKHFQVSIDMLVGNYHAQDRDIKPRAICEYLVRLIEHDDIKVFNHPVEEDIYSIDYDSRTYEQSCTHEKKTVNYDAFYFPAYWYIPDDVSALEYNKLVAEMTQCGNDTIHYQTNKFLHQFLQIYKLYKQNALEEETYRTVVSDLLSHVRD